MVKFNSTKAEGRIIRDIVQRGLRAWLAANPTKEVALATEEFDVQSAEMDITACHCNGCPLRLEDFLNADDFNFAHDFFGIRRHMNRDTGKLNGMFSPRFHQQQH